MMRRKLANKKQQQQWHDQKKRSIFKQQPIAICMQPSCYLIIAASEARKKLKINVRLLIENY